MRSTRGAPGTLPSGQGFLPLTEHDLGGLVCDRWQRLADTLPDREAIVHLKAGEAPYRWTWGALMDTALRIAASLHDAGVRRGEVCAIIMRHDPLFYPVYMGVCALGAVPSVLAYPNNRLHPEKFREGLEGMARRSGLDWVLTERTLDERIRPLLTRADSTVKGLLFPLEWSGSERAPLSHAVRSGMRSDDPCLLQHSSGTTGLQKAVMLSHRAVLEHIRRYGASLQLGPDDKVVSWLPLYHDMGLIGAFYLPLIAGVPLVQLDTFEWVSAPVLLLEAIAAEKGTICWLPNFAFNLMAERVDLQQIEGLGLGTMRAFISCSEPVRADSLDSFCARFARMGVKPTMMGASYAMAETTFAVTQTTIGRPPRTIMVDREALLAGQAVLTDDPARGRICVSSGAPIDGCTVRVVGEDGRDRPEGAVGDLLIRSVSMFDGYRNYQERTAEVLRDGWMHSGDIGFLYEGEYYVIGRKKDIIIVGGKNLYPEDIEDAVGKAPDIIPGRIVAFGVANDAVGTEQVCVVAETQETDPTRWKAVRLQVVQAAMAIDVTVSRVYLAPPRWLIKSSAGKPSRTANQERALNELTWR